MGDVFTRWGRWVTHPGTARSGAGVDDVLRRLEALREELLGGHIINII